MMKISKKWSYCFFCGLSLAKYILKKKKTEWTKKQTIMLNDFFLKHHQNRSALASSKKANSSRQFSVIFKIEVLFENDDDLGGYKSKTRQIQTRECRFGPRV